MKLPLETSSHLTPPSSGESIANPIFGSALGLRRDQSLGRQSRAREQVAPYGTQGPGGGKAPGPPVPRPHQMGPGTRAGPRDPACGARPRASVAPSLLRLDRRQPPARWRYQNWLCRDRDFESGLLLIGGLVEWRASSIADLWRLVPVHRRLEPGHRKVRCPSADLWNSGHFGDCDGIGRAHV